MVDREADHPGQVVEVEPVHDVRAMGLHGLHAEVQALGDLLRGETLRDELQHLPLPRCQQFPWVLSLADPAAVVLDHLVRDGGAQVRLSPTSRSHRDFELGRVGRLQQVPPSPDAERPQHVLLVGVHRQHHHLAAGGRSASELATHLETVQARQGHVDEGHVDVRALRPPQSLPAVPGFDDDLEPRDLLEQPPDPGPDEVVILDEHQTDARPGGAQEETSRMEEVARGCYDPYYMNPRPDLDSGLRIALPYLLVSFLWILLTDWLVEQSLASRWYDEAQTAKGLLFVVGSAVLVFVLASAERARGTAVLDDLRTTRDQLRRAQRIGRIGSWEVDLRSDVLSWSDQVFEIFGIPREAFWETEEEFFALVHPEDRDSLRADREAFLAGEGDLDARHRIIRPDGEIRWVHERAHLETDEEGTPIRMVGTVQEVSELVEVERRLEAQARDLRSLSQRLLEAQESERRAIARELHDQIGQSLTLAHLALQRAARDEDCVEPVHEAQASVAETLDRVRNLSLDLRPALLDDLGLLAALRWLADRQSRALEVEISLRADIGEELVPPLLRVPAYRVVQEALTNAVRHGQAKAVRVELARKGDRLLVTVRDDGRGFDPEGSFLRAREGASLGLLGMKERTELAGGDFAIRSVVGEGTEVLALFPLDSPPSA